MKAIWKFPVPTDVRFDLSMPKGAELLCVQTQDERGCIWAVVDPAAPMVGRAFAIWGTGHEYHNLPGKYVGTFQQMGGRLVWHLFDLGETP